MKILRANSPGLNVRSQITEMFIDGFGQWLTFFSKDNTVLVNTFNHIFLLDKFYIAVENDKVVGMVGCTESIKSSIKLDKSEFKKYLGFIKGTLSYYILKREFGKNTPGAKNGIGSIDFVATSKEYRGRGIAAAIINHIFAEVDYDEYILEVADTNTPAVNLYKKIGFKEYTRIKQKHAKQSGINYLIYLIYKK